MFSLDDQIVTHLFLDIVTDLALPGKLFLYLFATCLLSFKTQTHQTDIRTRGDEGWLLRRLCLGQEAAFELTSKD